MGEPGRAVSRPFGALMSAFPNLRVLFRGLRIALEEPGVRALATLAGALILLATVFYWLVEGWALVDAFYFSVVTIATVGYGDFAPQTVVGKLFTVGYIVAGIGLFVSAAASIAQAVIRSTPPEE
jgi:voltage-gated potassium channel